MNEDQKELLDQWRKDFEANENGDLVVLAGDRKFKVFKHILCLRSSVFAAMFNNNTEEQRTNVIKINDFEPKIVEKFLLYLYTATIDDLSKISELYPIADYYDVKRLRQLCLEQMFENLSVENVAECIELTDKYLLNDLKQKSLNFMAQNISEATVYDYMMLAKKYGFDGLESKIIEFIEINLASVSKSPQWEKFDAEFRLQKFQEFFNRQPSLEIENLYSARNVIDVDYNGDDIYDGFCSSYSLKNTGTTRLVYKADLVTYFHHKCDYVLEKGFLKPDESVDLHVKIDNYDSIVLISYETSDKENIENCFVQNSLVRQYRINPFDVHVKSRN